MSQIQRFLFFIVVLLLAAGLILGFGTYTKSRKNSKKYTKVIPTQITITPIPTATADHWDGYQSRDMVIEDKTYHVLVADTEQRQELGLMYITSLEGYDGMVFPFPDLSIKSFWNKNTLVDLQIYWMNDDQVVGKEILPSIYKTGDPKTITSPAAVNTVVELLVTK